MHQIIKNIFSLELWTYAEKFQKDDLGLVYLNFQGYPASKTLAEKAAWKFAEENNIDLITVIPTLMAGASLTPDIPSSIGLAMALITGKI